MSVAVARRRTFFRNPFRRKSVLELSTGGKIVAYVSLIAWTLIVLFPMYWLPLTSLKTPIQVNAGPFFIPFVDFQPTGDNWHYVFVDIGSDTLRPYINTVIVGLTSATISVVLGSLAAYGMVRFRYRPRVGMIVLGIGTVAFSILAVAIGVPAYLVVVVAIGVFVILAGAIVPRVRRTLGNADIAFWLISQRIMPPVAVVIPIYVFFQRIGLLDSLFALIITYAATNLPIVVWLMRDYFSSIPMELEEAASVDGASPYRIFRSIILPVAAPGLVATFVLVLVFAWNEYLLVLFLASANAQTMPLLVAAQNASRGPQYWYMSVLILIMIIPVIVMAVILERFISRGILTGSVKG